MRLLAGFDDNGNRIVEDAKKAKEAAQEIGLVFQSAASDAIRNWKGVGNLLKSIALDIAQMMFKKAVVNPIADALGGAVSMGIKAIFGGARADGGPVMAGKTYLVGERGPELFTAGNSGSITPNHALSNGGGTYYIDARGADSAGMARLENMIRQLHGNVSRMAVAAVSDYRIRTGAPA